jgi:hypothetical protein
MMYQLLKKLYPQLTPEDFSPHGGTIQLRNDSDGGGDYIASWGHPILARPTDAQIAELKASA